MTDGRPKRKNIRLPGYDYSGAGCYFVTICTHQRQPLFASIAGAWNDWNTETRVGADPRVRPWGTLGFVRGYLYALEEKYPGVKIDCCAVMPDHVHALVVIPGGHMGPPLPGMMQWYKTQVTNAYIRAVRAGEAAPYEKYLWQRNYYEHVIRNDADLADTRQYIENNPLKLKKGITNNGEKEAN